jgi:hypothetical protein
MKEDTMPTLQWPTHHRPAAVLALAASTVLFTAGGAYAYWSVSGSGTGQVTVAPVKPLVIEQARVKGLVLGRSADLNGKVTNPNDFEASLLGTEITVKVISDAHHQGCDVRNFAIEAPSTKATLIKSNGTLKLDKGSITMLNTRTDQAACHGATLTLEYRLQQAPKATPAQAPAASGGVTSTTAPTTPCTTRQTPSSSIGPTAGPTSTIALTSTARATSTATATATADASSALP